MTLYRKYRPKVFSDVVGQEKTTRILTEEIKRGNISHAYLFSGPRGTGKTSVARIFAKSLNCKNRSENAEPCNKCESCEAILKGSNTDLIEIDAASNRRIDEVRELREHVRYMPSSSVYKVYIIDEVHMLTTEAFNALLKTLEEPPSYAIFILATTELNKIPETIFSRCQHFSFSKLSLVEIAERLKKLCEFEKVSVEEEVILEIARRSGGALRDAESLLGQIISVGKKEIKVSDASMFLPSVGFLNAFSFFKLLAEKDAKSALLKVSSLEEEGVNMDILLFETLSVSRSVLIFKATQDPLLLEQYYSKEEINQISEISNSIKIDFLRFIVSKLLSASQDMKISADIPILPLELAIVEICSKEDDSNQSSSTPSNISNNKSLDSEPKNIEIKKEVKISFNDQQKENMPLEAKEQEFSKIDKIETIEIQEESRNSKDSSDSLDDILQGWGEVLSKVRDKNAALNFILGVAEPVAVRGKIVELGFKYRLQQEKVEEVSNRHVVEGILEEVYGAKYKIETSLNTNAKPFKQKEKESFPSNEEILIKTALDVFEGAVLEN